MSQQNILLPPQYDLQKLAIIFHGNRSHWTEFISLKDIREAQKNCMNSWLAAIFRYQPYRRDTMLSIDNQDENTKEKIFERLRLYDSPKPPPHLVKEKLLMGNIHEGKATLSLLQTEYKILEYYARCVQQLKNFEHLLLIVFDYRQFNMMVKEHNAMDGNYKDAVRFLYKNEAKFRVKTASCSRVFEKCTGTATIRLEVNYLDLFFGFS